ncbi:MAG: NADP-dependent phosphogluconate dehydrogenase [Bacteriovoracaceae bacterium]|nr:NADP-dependent phosphogluconate dehydrogenase [Bacteriovoracaceae bacterium]
MEFAIIGLGKMGAGLAHQALRKGANVIGLTNGEPDVELIKNGLIVAHDLEHLYQLMKSPRKVLLYLPAGVVIEDYIEKFSNLFDVGDIVLDGGNSYWGDSVRRHKTLKKSGIDFLDVGTSGGISGARDGACFMVGGERSAFEEVEHLLELMAAPEAVHYVGPAGCGHLTKLVHNGIEFGMLQAIGEGMALLEKYRESMPLEMESVFKAYRNASVIRSWLIDLMAEQYQVQKDAFSVSPYVEDTGEVNWLVSDALRLEVPLPVITQSVIELFRSRDDRRIDYRSIALMRHGFGGHPFGPKEELRFERAHARIGPF